MPHAQRDALRDVAADARYAMKMRDDGDTAAI
jgi:hypothetical protein